MEIEAIYGNVIGLDVHQQQITACALVVDKLGRSSHQIEEFSTFKGSLISLTDWAQAKAPEIIAMESTGIYWKSAYRALTAAGLPVIMVNAREVSRVPGRKTDISDSLWLAMLGRAGLLRAGFVPSAKFDDLRILSRQRQKLTQTLAAEKNRLNKILAGAGIRLGCVVSDPHGQAARRMTICLIDGGSPQEALALAGNRLKAKPSDLLAALEGDLTDIHRFILQEIMDHIIELESRVDCLGRQLIQELSEHQWALDLLQTIPGLDQMGSAMLLVEIGADMEVFGSAERLASWAGLCPGNNESGGKRKSGKMRKGNQWVRRILCEAANAAKKTASMFQSKYKSLVGTRGHKRTIMALAHRILKIVFHLLQKKEPYKDSTVNYEELMVKKKAPRWIRALSRYNLLPR